MSKRFLELKDGEYFRFEGTFYRKTNPKLECTYDVMGMKNFNARSMYNMQYVTFVDDTVVEPYKV